MPKGITNIHWLQVCSLCDTLMAAMMDGRGLQDEVPQNDDLTKLHTDRLAPTRPNFVMIDYSKKMHDFTKLNMDDFRL